MQQSILKDLLSVFGSEDVLKRFSRKALATKERAVEMNTDQTIGAIINGRGHVRFIKATDDEIIAVPKATTYNAE